MRGFLAEEEDEERVRGARGAREEERLRGTGAEREESVV